MSTINVTNLSGRGGATPNLPDGANITGVATASGGFSGNLTGNVTGTGLTTGSDGSINVTSIRSVGVSTLGNVVITGAVGGGATVGAYAGVTTFYGDGSNLVGAGDSIAPWNYNPDVGDSGVMLDELSTSGIGITFNKKVSQGSSGTATLKIVNAGVAGTTIQSWGVSSTTYSITAFSLDTLVSDLTLDQTYQVDIPEGFIVDSAGTSYVGTAYTFTATGPVNKLWSWGQNTSGVLGHNNTTNYSSPVQVGGINWLDIADSGSQVGNYQSYSTKTDGTLWGWGHNGKGQLGQNNDTNYSSPIQITGTNWATVSDCYYGVLASKTDGTLWSWGYGSYGQLGVNSTVDYSSPVQVPGTTWGQTGDTLYGSRKGASVIKTDGTLWTWGENDKGQGGDNSVVHKSSPTQIPGTTWSSVTSNGTARFATKTDGTLWAWGENESGQLGQNQPHPSKVSSPVQIPGTTWSEISAGGRYHMHAVKTDGTLWSWGDNDNGEMGVNTVNNGYSSPVQVGSDTTWNKIAGAHYHVLATKTDGTLWSWGYGGKGQLGQNALQRLSSPVQIPGTEWTGDIAGGTNASWAVQKDYTP